ncbi:MAG TPA: Sec-independent protein translocase protein TatB [Candidatus Angelobacter sp.]|nr:Sec-independent protein translocase protein TatB [Candidatus Angelobacter sp.]
MPASGSKGCRSARPPSFFLRMSIDMPIFRERSRESCGMMERAMNFSFSEILFIMILALILFGPRKLPEIARQIGKFMAEFRRTSSNFQNQIQDEIRKMEIEENAKKLISPAGEVLKNSENSIATTISRLTDKIKSLPQDYDA